jgi:hypothetical protein
MAERTSYNGLPGWVEVAEDGLVSGSGESVAAYMADQRRIEAEERARLMAVLPGAVATTQSIAKPRGPRCSVCGVEVVLLLAGRCEACQGPNAAPSLAPPTMSCPNCGGSGKIDVPEVAAAPEAAEEAPEKPVGKAARKARS